MKNIGRIMLDDKEYNRTLEQSLDIDFQLQSSCSDDQLNVYSRLSVDCYSNYLKITFADAHNYKLFVGNKEGYRELPFPYIVNMIDPVLPLFIKIKDGTKETVITINK